MYSLAHLHLLLNHLPIIVPIVALLVLLAAFLRGSDVMARTSLGILVFGAITALPSYLTGDAAEGAVRRAPGVTRDIIEAHASAALSAALMLGVAGVFALWALWKFSSAVQVPRWVLGTVLVLTLVSSAAMARVGLLGGAVRHTEVRSDPPPAFGVGMVDTSRRRVRPGPVGPDSAH